ncbi:MAG: D-inositol-3-phosphate glycosyltransferase [Thermoleophilaceae bacterium]|nr:D-inositol-3-phosphate glycosyltransferase [Thermoleophilaceae bacterium]
MSGGPPLRVAMLAPAFWPEVRRGGERLVRELADDLIRRGHHPRLITSHPGPPSRTEEDGLPIVRSWRPPARRLRRREFEDYLTHVPFSYLELLRGHDHIAHATHHPDAVAAARWGARTGRPSVLTFLGLPTRVGLAGRRMRAELLARAARECSATVAISRTAADGFRRWLGVDARVIYPSVDLDAFRLGHERTPEPTILCMADASAENKRVPLLIEALAHVRRSRPDARLLLQRPADPVLAARLRASGDGVELVDPGGDREALAELYRTSWVSALPSWGEAFGLVLVEALACGTPVVGSDLGAIPEVVDRDSIGRLFSGHEAPAVAEVLLGALELAEDPATRAACRARAADFSTERMGQEYLSLYRELLA